MNPPDTPVPEHGGPNDAVFEHPETVGPYHIVEVLGRFQAERQALAVMELVRGIRIDEYCDRFRLTPHDRIALFMSLCQAVQHAHQKGVIHRDLKPTNILVGALNLYRGALEEAEDFILRSLDIRERATSPR